MCIRCSVFLHQGGSILCQAIASKCYAAGLSQGGLVLNLPFKNERSSPRCLSLALSYIVRQLLCC